MVTLEQQSEQDIEALFVCLLRRHLTEQLSPLLVAINQLIGQLIEQVEIREQLARRDFEENHTLRIEVAKLAAIVTELRNGSPADTATNLQQVN
jgi:hypothetical protein